MEKDDNILTLIQSNKELEKKEQERQFREGAMTMKMVFDAYVYAGFTESESLKIILTHIAEAGKQ